MKYIFRKAGISMLTGAACTFGSWMTKHLLDKVNKTIINNSKKSKEAESV